MTTITSVNVDVAQATVTITFSDNSTQVITAPLVPQTQGTSLADLQQIQSDVVVVQTDVTAAIADSTPAVPATEAVEPVINPTE